jgi:predicted NBD/HSP70 family sugar kinase
VRLLDEAAPPYASVAICLGAAMDESRGTVYGSGPLWGDYTGPLPLTDILTTRRPDVEWHLHNDLTCGVAALAELAPPWARQITYITVSSGVALRTANLATATVDVDQWGMQGEIGHGPAVPHAPDLAAHAPLPCDCGGTGHVASIASGPGIARAARLLGLEPPGGIHTRLTTLLDEGDPRAHTLLAEAVRPIGQTIRTLWHLRPHAEFVGIGGGVATGLVDHYERALHRQLVQDRSYSDAGRDHEWVRQRVRVTRPEECDLMTGARLLAEGRLHPTPPALASVPVTTGRSSTR